jgi:hypothetical protein
MLCILIGNTSRPEGVYAMRIFRMAILSHGSMVRNVWIPACTLTPLDSNNHVVVVTGSLRAFFCWQRITSHLCFFLFVVWR